MSPIYTYYCSKCLKETELVSSIASRPETISCETCSGPAHYTVGAPHFTVNGANANNNYSGESNFKWIGKDKK